MKKILSALLASIPLLAVLGTSEPPAQARPVVVLGAFCRDGYAVRRCAPVSLTPVGNACFCSGQGRGRVCT